MKKLRTIAAFFALVLASWAQTGVPAVHGAPSYAAGFAYLPNLTVKQIIATGTNTDLDLYTVAAGKRAVVGLLTVWNASGGSITSFTEVKISGTYYRTGNSAATANGAGSTANFAYFGIVLEAGQSFSINGTVAGLYITGTVYEFDNTASVRSKVLTTFAAADNTVFTCCDSGYTKAALAYGNLLGPNNAAAGGLNLSNSSGGALTYNWYLPAGCAATGAGNRVITTSSIANLGTSLSLANAALVTGDCVVLNSTSTGTQFAWVTIIEYP